MTGNDRDLCAPSTTGRPVGMRTRIQMRESVPTPCPSAPAHPASRTGGWRHCRKRSFFFFRILRNCMDQKNQSPAARCLAARRLPLPSPIPQPFLNPLAIADALAGAPVIRPCSAAVHDGDRRRPGCGGSASEPGPFIPAPGHTCLSTSSAGPAGPASVHAATRGAPELDRRLAAETDTGPTAAVDPPAGGDKRPTDSSRRAAVSRQTDPTVATNARRPVASRRPLASATAGLPLGDADGTATSCPAACGRPRCGRRPACPAAAPGRHARRPPRPAAARPCGCARADGRRPRCSRAPSAPRRA